MKRLQTVEDLEALREGLSHYHESRLPTVVIPAGTCGRASGAGELVNAAEKVIRSNGWEGKLRLRVTGCHGYCQQEPSLLIEPERFFYPRVNASSVERIIVAAVNGEVLDELLLRDPETGQPQRRQDEVLFFRKQVRAILARNEKVDPLDVATYLVNGGYAALGKVLRQGEPAWVLAEIKASRLRGRGGAGFPTGLKWELLAAQGNGRGKLLVCNADEGDPGAYMDRSVLEGNPHSIIEGMLIGAYATGASEGVVYVRNEYPLAIEHLAVALQQARELGLLGDDILGSGLGFRLHLVRGAGAFVCGEETALIRSIAGKMGEPRQRPPFPVSRGIDGKPTVINNVETWANVSLIVAQGAAEFLQVGTTNNSGTKIFSLVGKIANTGLVEVPMGISIREIVEDIGGGPVGRLPIKAVQTGGPSGGCIPTSRFDLPIDYDSLAQAGSIMGSGGMIVMDGNTCMVDLAKYFTGFLKDLYFPRFSKS
jgi:NADH-quinone oxidoreductase subunit F